MSKINTDNALWHYSTMKVGGEARSLYHPQNIDELAQLLDKLNSSGETFHILGGGSNMLISSSGVEGSVIRMTNMNNITNPEQNILEADAGVRLPHLAKYAANLGLSGLEFAVGIPGTVGGAVVMNAGAHNSCMANIVENVTVYDTKSRKLKTLTSKELNFKYRHSAINPGSEIVLKAKLQLKPDLAETIKAVTQHNEEYRWRTQPLGWPNLGSTFVNPAPDKSAGYLLDLSGAKELKEGQAAVSAIHANFVINLGGADSEDILKLLQHMQKTVEKKFDVHLKPEWKTLGHFSSLRDEIWGGK